jgi:hypothetical protein
MSFSHKPIIVYGIRRHPDHSTEFKIIFHCLFPVALIPMNSDLFCVVEADHRSAGYTLTGVWEDLARQAGEHVYRLAESLQHVGYLSHLYILRSGFVALGGTPMAERAEEIFAKMKQVLRDSFGEIKFSQAPGSTLWVPSVAESKGVLSTQF